MRLAADKLRWQLSRVEWSIAMRQSVADTRAHIEATRRQLARVWALLRARGYR